MSLSSEKPTTLPVSIQNTYSLCRSLYKSEAYSECLSKLESTDISSISAMVYLKGKLSLKTDDLSAAESTFHSLLDVPGKTKISSLFKLGMISKRREKFTEAIEFFEEALENNQSKASKMKTYCYLASCFLRLKDIETAEKKAKLAESSYRNEQSMAFSAWVKLEKGLYEEAIDQIAACKVSFNTKPELYLKLKYILALCLVKKGWYVEAVATLSEIPEQQYHTICLSGAIYATAGQYSDARIHFEQAIATFPERWEAYFNLAFILQNSEESAGFFDSASRLCPHELPQNGVVVPEIDIAEYLFEGKISSVQTNTPPIHEQRGIVVKKRSHESDVHEFPMKPLIGLPMLPLPNEKRFTSGFMKKLTEFVMNVGKKVDLNELTFGKRNGNFSESPEIKKRQKR